MSAVKAGPHLFIPRDPSHRPLYAMVCDDGRGNHCRFFQMSGARAGEMRIPVAHARKFGIFVKMGVSGEWDKTVVVVENEPHESSEGVVPGGEESFCSIDGAGADWMRGPRTIKT